MATTIGNHTRRTSGRGGGSRSHPMNTTRGPPVNVRRNGSGLSQYSHQVPSGVYMNELMIRGLMNLVGKSIQLTVKNGAVYEGILSAISPNMDVHLSFGHLVSSTLTRDNMIPSIIFNRSDITEFGACSLDLDSTSRDNFTDSAISRNGQSLERGEPRELEPWVSDSGEEPNLALENDANGWDAHDMFKKNAEQFSVKSTYDESLLQYTTPLVKKNDREYRIKEEEAERIAREIESSDTYKSHISLENGDGDEEMRFSAVHRPSENSSSSNRYIPPNQRAQQNNPQQNLAGHGLAANMTHPRDRKERERGWENQAPKQTTIHGQVQSSLSSHHGPHMPNNIPPAGTTHMQVDQKINGEREHRVMGESLLPTRPAPQKNMTNIVPSQPVSSANLPLIPNQHHSPERSIPVAQVSHVPHQHAGHALSQGVASTISAVEHASPLAAPSVTLAHSNTSAERVEARVISPQFQTGERKSPRDKEKLEGFKRFSIDFKLKEGAEDQQEREDSRSDSADKDKEDKMLADNKLSDSVVKNSTLNPNAKEFRPASCIVTAKGTPAPSPTPPSVRQSPVIAPPMLPVQGPSHNIYQPAYVMQKMMPNISTAQPNVPQAKSFTTKRAVVSVDALAAHHATGQPLLAAQAAAMPGQQYSMYSHILPQGAASTYQIMSGRVMSHTMPHQGAMDQQASAQTATQLFVAPQGHGPIPAHMSHHPNAQAMNHPQPAHVQQHQAHHQAQSGQLTPLPSASPVQHMGPPVNSTGQAHHTQNAPPTSGTPQPSLSYGQQMGIHPPMQASHAHPAHAGHNNPAPQPLHQVSVNYMGHSIPLSLIQGGAHMSFSQPGNSGSGGGPSHAHLQHTAHGPMGQAHHHVVVMPQPPPHSVNQPVNPQYQQHHMQSANAVHSGSGGQNHHPMMPANMQQSIAVSGNGIMHHPAPLHHHPFLPPGVNPQGGHYQSQ